MDASLQTQIAAWAPGLAIVVVSFLAGYAIDRYILLRLLKYVYRHDWSTPYIFVRSLRGLSVLWLTICGLYLAFDRFRLDWADTFQSFLIGAFIFTLTIASARFAGGFLHRQARRAHAGVFVSATILENLIKGLIFIVGLMLALEAFGVSVTPMLTALGVGGLAVALALQETLTNFFCGVQIVATRQIKQGDYIKLENGEEGYVTDINWRFTKIETLQHYLVIIPNTKLASTIVTNYSLPRSEMLLWVKLRVPLDVDLDRTEAILLEIAGIVLKETPGGCAEFEPYVRYQNFEDFAVSLNLVLEITDYAAYIPVKHRLVKDLSARFRAEGIHIPVPRMDVSVKTPNF